MFPNIPPPNTWCLDTLRCEKQPFIQPTASPPDIHMGLINMEHTAPGMGL